MVLGHLFGAWLNLNCCTSMWVDSRHTLQNCKKKKKPLLGADQLQNPFSYC